MVPTVQHGADGIMIWGCMAASGAGYMVLCEGRMNFKRYEAMLDKTLKPSVDYLFEPSIYPTVGRLILLNFFDFSCGVSSFA